MRRDVLLGWGLKLLPTVSARPPRRCRL